MPFGINANDLGLFTLSADDQPANLTVDNVQDTQQMADKNRVVSAKGSPGTFGTARSGSLIWYTQEYNLQDFQYLTQIKVFEQDGLLKIMADTNKSGHTPHAVIRVYALEP